MGTDDIISTMSIADNIQTEADAYKFLEDLRWGVDNERQVCPKCGSVRRFYLIKPQKTRTGANTGRRRWKCADCRHQFSVLTGTIFHGTKIPVRKWVFVIYEMCASKNGVSAREIERKYGLTPKSAWFMLHRIREAMKRDPLAGMLSGRIVADETYIGGKPKNKHRQGKGRQANRGGTTHLTPVVSLVDKDTGEVRSKVMNTVTRDNLREVITEHVDVPESHLETDKSKMYDQIGREFVSHEAVDHGRNEYVRYVDGEPVGTNPAESYFAQLKRSIDGTHHHVSPEHLQRYVDQFDFMYSTSQLTDDARMRKLVGEVGPGRLTYRPLTER